jgi:cytidylate kinase
MTSRRLIIAIDGPSGAGKGTVARTIASRLNYQHIDTGAMYRAVAWLALREGADLEDEARVAGIARSATFELSGAIRANGHDVSSEIRTPAMDKAAAAVARHPAVRAVLVERQRAAGQGGGIVMEGRDIGSVVFPDADVKIYLDATPTERARRRAGDPAHSTGREAKALDEVQGELAARDTTDSTRAVSPLTQAPDAIYMDTTGVPIDDVVTRVLDIVSRA